MTRALLLAVLLLPLAARADLGLNVYGLSYHLDRDKARQLGVDNEFNPGLGVRWRNVEKSFDWFADVGFYRDSGRNTALLAGGGALWHAGENLRLGGALALLHSDTYNKGKTFVAPLPVAAYDFKRVTLNMVFLPKVHEVNDINTLGFWATVWLR
jgi:hypothetical protein